MNKRLADLMVSVDDVMVEFEDIAKTGGPSAARVAAMAASDLHGILTRWYGWERSTVGE